MGIVEQLVEWRLLGETEVLGENLPQRHFVHQKSNMTWPSLEPGRRGGKPVTNSLSYGTATTAHLTKPFCKSLYCNRVYLFPLFQNWSRDSSVGTVTGYGLDDRASIPGRGKIFFSTPQHPNLFRGPSSFLPNVYRGLFPRK
jgi:hypothetical protein